MRSWDTTNLRLNGERALLALAHVLQAFIPAADDLPSAKLQGQRGVAVVGRVEFGTCYASENHWHQQGGCRRTIEQSSFVVHLDRIASLGLPLALHRMCYLDIQRLLDLAMNERQRDGDDGGDG